MPSAGTSSVPSPSLPGSHPLIAELTSLRQQLAQYQKSGHQSAIQLQGARLESNLAKEESALLRETNETLRSEIKVLRTHPLPPTQPPTSTALAELTLAHRRLSTKLDLTEQALQSAQLELASCSQEITRLNKEREGDRATINELRRGDEEREEEIAWERGERRKAEALKRLCDLALDDYKDLVRSLDPNAVPPSSPSMKVIDPPTDLSSAIEPQTETESESQSASPPTPPPTTGESISNLLVGQRGVNRLFEDFTSTLSSKDKELHRLKDRVEELEHTLSTITDQLASETSLRIEAESQRDKILRDDASAAKVVERYMTFTQKTHATVHLHLDNLRARSAATQYTLRKELARVQSKLASESERAERLRVALDEASENVMREVGGRRREVGLRLKMISNEEKRERKIEIWLDRVRRQRDGVEGAVLEADILESLLDEGIEAYSLDRQNTSTANSTSGPSLNWSMGTVSKDKQRSWKGMSMLGRRRGNSILSTETGTSDGGEAASLARILLAEELVDTLVKDLQIETEKRMALEQQRVEWLAQEAVEGREVEEVDGQGQGEGVMFDLEQHEREEGDLDTSGEPQDGDHETGDQDRALDKHGDKAEARDQEGSDAISQTDNASDPIVSGTDAPDPAPTPMTIPLETPPPLEPHPNLLNLQRIFTPLQDRYQPLQTSLHSLSYSLSNLRSSLPSSSKRLLSRKSSAPLSDPMLFLILENIHEALEDARVDVEIAIADEDRVYRGFEALLGVGGSGGGTIVGGSTSVSGGGVVQTKDVLADARAFVEHKNLSSDFGKLETKVKDLELDLSNIKSKVHEIEGMDLTSLEQMAVPEAEGQGQSDETSTTSTTSQPQSRSNSNPSSTRSTSLWSKLDLRTVNSSSIDLSPQPSYNESGSGSGSEQQGPGPRKPSLFGGVSSVGRSFSASVIGAPRKVGGFAGGLYRPRGKKATAGGEEEGLIKTTSTEGDDVE